MEEKVRSARRISGTVSPPGDKSVSHRAAMFNAIAEWEAVIENFLRGADCLDAGVPAARLVAVAGGQNAPHQRAGMNGLRGRRAC
jgi:3-phosphoshikimate 1-carboxyvinyltransferase